LEKSIQQDQQISFPKVNFLPSKLDDLPNP